MMTQTQWDELYRKLWDAYVNALKKDEYVTSSLQLALDHMILLKQKQLIRN